LDSDGQYLWSNAIRQNTGDYGVTDVALDPSGNVHWGTKLGGTVDFADAGDGGPGWFDTPGGGTWPFLVKLTSHGDLMWSRVFPTGTGNVFSLAVDSNGNTYVAGTFVDAPLSFGGPGTYSGPPDSGVAERCDTDSGLPMARECEFAGYVVKVSPEGDLAWATAVQDENTVTTDEVTVDSLGAPWIVLSELNYDYYYDDAGGLSLSSNTFETFIKRLDPSIGGVAWSTSIPVSSAGVLNVGITADGLGNVYVTDSSGGITVLPGGYDAGQPPGLPSFVAELSPDGDTAWGLLPGDRVFSGVTVDRCAGELVVSGQFLADGGPSFAERIAP